MHERSRERRRLIGGLAIGLFLAQIVGCSSCVDDVKKEEQPSVGGKALGTRPSNITDKRPHFAPEEGGTDASSAP
jgi:hypothetical protein